MADLETAQTDRARASIEHMRTTADYMRQQGEHMRAEQGKWRAEHGRETVRLILYALIAAAAVAVASIVLWEYLRPPG